ncbi:MAG: ABC transporter substrate-binding protein [Bryobacteraceae bacterium]
MRTVILLCLLATSLWAQPKRIVSAAPSITEMLFALGLGDRVVGVTDFCRYPAEAESRPKIGSYLRPNLETILAMRPDLVIIQKNPSQLASKLRSMRLEVLELDHDTIPKIHDSITKIGAAAGVPESAAKLNARIRSQLDEIRRKTAALPRRRLMFIVGRTPGTLDGLVAVGKASYLTEVMEAAGGVNVFAEAATAYPKISLEEVLSRNPDVIVDMGDMAKTVAVSEEHKRSVVELWRRYQVLKAVKQDRVFAVAADIFVVPGPRVIDAALAFARMLHPEAGL